YGALKGTPQVFDACVGDGCKNHRGFASFCEVTRGDQSCLSGNKGALFFPLAYSAVLAGLAWMAGSTWLPDDDTSFWISLSAGLAIGVSSYGLSAALDDAGPRRP